MNDAVLVEELEVLEELELLELELLEEELLEEEVCALAVEEEVVEEDLLLEVDSSSASSLDPELDPHPPQFQFTVTTPGPRLPTKCLNTDGDASRAPCPHPGHMSTTRTVTDLPP